MDIIRKLHFADYISFISLFFAWAGIWLLLYNEPNFAIITNMAAFLFDCLDGYIARKYQHDTVFGRQVDSYVDIFTYLIFAVILFTKYISPHFVIGLIVSFSILLFGGLRLIRFNSEGILEDQKDKYYRGVTVVHMSFVTLICYFLQSIISLNNWLSSLLLFLISLSMISDYKSYKIRNFFFFAGIIILFTSLSLLLEYGYTK